MASALDEAESLYGGAQKKPKSALEEAEALPAPPKMGKAKAGILGGGQGASFATADEGTGVVAGLIEGTRPGRWLGEKFGLLSRDFKGNLRGGTGDILEDAKGDASGANFMRAFRGGRDTAREELQQARQDQPLVAYGSEVATSLINPIKAPIKGPGAIRAGGRALVEGAAYSAGASEADLTKGEYGDFAMDTGLGGLASGALAAGTNKAATGAANTYKALRGSDKLKSRIIHEAAQGPLGKASPTAQKHLDRAQDAIAEEVIAGPDGDRVRRAFLGDAKAGREELAGVLSPVRAKRDAAYEAFRAAGKADVDPAAYRAKLQAEVDAAIAKGKGKRTKALRAAMAEFDEQVANGGGKIDLVALRGFTTDVQDTAASAVGGLNEHSRARLANQVKAVVTKAMGETLEEAAAGDEALTAAAKAITETNRRTDALLTGDKALKARQFKETTGEPLLPRVAKKAAASVAGAGTLGAIGAIAGGDDERLENAALYGSVGLGVGSGLPWMARKLSRGHTTRMIKNARRGESPARNAVAKVAASGAPRPFLARFGEGARRKKEDEE